MQYWQDRANEADLMLESNIEVLDAIKSFYTGLSEHPDFPDLLKSGCADSLKEFLEALEDFRGELHAQSRRAKFLVKIIADRKVLISQHLQDQAAERMEKLNRHMEKEAKVVRIITVLTLIYLPATFVSVSNPAKLALWRLICVQTFFGTDVVKFQKDDDDIKSSGSFSWPALLYWVGITCGLTVITLISAWYAYRKYERRALHGGDPSKEEGFSHTTQDVGRLQQLERVRKWLRSIAGLSKDKAPISSLA